MGIWRISKQFNNPLHKSLINAGADDYPYTISFVIRKRQQIDGFLELPQDKQPPRDIWDRPSELEEWFDRVYSHGEKQTEFKFNISDKDIED